MLTMAHNLPSRAYNIGNGQPVTYQQMAGAVKRVYPNAQIELQPGRPPRAQPYRGMEIGLIKDHVGWEPQYDINRGMAEWIEWLQTHPE
jgi:nucleoside-diphosphate-sugar epimerase